MSGSIVGSVVIIALLWILSGGSSGTTNAAPKPISACSLVSLEDAKGMWDAAAQADIVGQDSPLSNGQSRATCRYKVFASDGQHVAKYMTVEVTRPVTRAQFETGKQQDEMAFNPTIGKVQNVAGLGAQGYSFGFYGFGVVTFLKGQYAVKVTVEYKSDNANVDPARIVAGLVPIARKAADRVP